MLSKRNRNFISDKIIPQIIQLPWQAFSFSCLHCSPSSWMTGHAHTSNAISWVFTAQILSELKLIWHILQTDLVFIQQTIAHEGHPQKTRPLILIGVKRANIFVITLECIGCSQSKLWDPCNFFPSSAVNIFVFVWSDQWNPCRKKKYKLYLAFSVFFFLLLLFFLFFYHPNPSRVVSWKRSMLYIVLYYHVEDTNPLPIKPRSACPVAKSSGGSAYLYGSLILILFPQTVTAVKFPQTCYCNSIVLRLLSITADAHLRTLDDGVIGYCLHIAPIVIKGQVPHPWVEGLDEPGLVDEDGMIQVTGSPVLFGNQPAAIQQLHKIIL